VVDRASLLEVLTAVREGRREVEEAVDALAQAPFVRLPYATVDTARAVRTGVAEIVYGAGKSAEQIIGIFGALHAAGQDAIATRTDAAKAEIVCAAFERIVWHREADVLVSRVGAEPARVGRIGVVDAGTSDLRVSDEVRVVAEALGNEVLAIHDVGVAGVHRVLARVGDLRSCRVIVVVAGMDGALPGVVAGLVDVPVVAVPTSVGYGASYGGLAALLTMLNACAPGVSVVNIDNGFGAAYQASLINHMGL
jgi:hypothetical protein